MMKRLWKTGGGLGFGVWCLLDFVMSVPGRGWDLERRGSSRVLVTFPFPRDVDDTTANR